MCQCCAVIYLQVAKIWLAMHAKLYVTYITASGYFLLSPRLYSVLTINRPQGISTATDAYFHAPAAQITKPFPGNILSLHSRTILFVPRARPRFNCCGLFHLQQASAAAVTASANCSFHYYTRCCALLKAGTEKREAWKRQKFQAKLLQPHFFQPRKEERNN